MDPQELVAWLDDLLERYEGLERIHSEWTGYSAEGVAWMVEAEAVVQSTFPLSHPLRRAWDDEERWAFAAVEDAARPQAIGHARLGILRAARSMAAKNRLGGLLDKIRADDLSGILRQARYLAEANFVQAAMVLAGAALEMHLGFLCEKFAVPFEKTPSITAYNQALAAARKQGTPVYEVEDVDTINGWAKIRNKAAHKPTEFKRSKEEVLQVIEGIRLFLARSR